MSQAQGADALATVLAIVERRCLEEIQQAFVGVWETQDSKTTLQERAAALALPPPVYDLWSAAAPTTRPASRSGRSLGEPCRHRHRRHPQGAQAEAARILLQSLPAVQAF